MLKSEAQTLRELRVTDKNGFRLLTQSDQRHEHNFRIEDRQLMGQFAVIDARFLSLSQPFGQIRFDSSVFEGRLLIETHILHTASLSFFLGRIARMMEEG